MNSVRRDADRSHSTLQRCADARCSGSAATAAQQRYRHRCLLTTHENRCSHRSRPQSPKSLTAQGPRSYWAGPWRRQLGAGAKEAEMSKKRDRVRRDASSTARALREYEQARRDQARKQKQERELADLHGLMKGNRPLTGGTECKVPSAAIVSNGYQNTRASPSFRRERSAPTSRLLRWAPATGPSSLRRRL